MYKMLRSVIVGLTIGTLLTIGLIVWFLKANESLIIDRVLIQLEEETTIQLSNDQLELSFWAHFPNVSLLVEDVVIPQPDTFFGFKNTDTMLVARQLYVNTDLIPLLLRRIQINHIGIQQGEIHIARNSGGDLNLQTLISKSADGSRGRSPLKIDAFQLEDVLVTYYQESNLFYLNHHVDKAHLSVLQTKKSFNLDFKLKGKLQSIESKGLNINKTFQVTYSGTLQGEKQRWTAHDVLVTLDGLKFLTEGIIDTDVPPEYEFVFSGDKLEAERVERLLVKAGYNLPDNIHIIKGEVGVQGRIEALRPRPQMQITLDFFGEKLHVQLAKNELKKGTVEGRLSMNSLANHYRIEVTKSYFQTLGGNFSGNLLLRKARQRQVSIALEGELPLDALISVVRQDFKGQAGGSVYLNYHYDGLFPKNNKEFLLSPEATIDLGFNNNSLSIYQPRGMGFSNIHGSLIKAETLRVDSLSGKFQGSNFLVVAELIDPELLSTQQEIQRTFIKGEVQIDSLNTASFARTSGADSYEKKRESMLFPEKVEGALSCRLGTFIHHSFSAKDVGLTLQYKPGMITLGEVEMRIAKGRVRAGGVLMQKMDGEMSLRAQGNMTKLSIDELFRSVDNFGQNYLRNDHLGGQLSGTLQFQTNLSTEGEIILPSLKTHSKIRVEEGELIGFEPMMGLSKFIDVEELKHIRFSTLENQISIANQQISIPQMDIHSSAFNITAAGEHSFSNKFDYHLKVLLSDVFSSRLNKQKHKDESFGAIEEDGLGNTAIYLRIEGTPTEYDVSYDRHAVRQAMRKRVKQEKKVLKEILNQEFGWFSKDTLKRGNGEEETHQIEFEPKAKPTKKEKEKEKDGKPRFQIVFEEDTTTKR